MLSFSQAMDHSLKALGAWRNPAAGFIPIITGSRSQPSFNPRLPRGCKGWGQRPLPGAWQVSGDGMRVLMQGQDGAECATLLLPVVISVLHAPRAALRGKPGVVLLPGQLPASHGRDASHGQGTVCSSALPALLSPGRVFLAHPHHHPYCRI